MTKRLAIAISGAVSLGSYEAGVLYEIIRALGEHNLHPDTIAHPDQRIEIDVLTGASAGAMTAAIAAQKLLFEKGALDGEKSNALYRPWVIDVDLAGLLKMQGTDDSRRSILSSALVEKISKTYLTGRYGAGQPPVERHPASAARVCAGFAMSNLNGVDYFQQQVDGSKFPYTRFQDEFKTDLRAGDPDSDSLEKWENIRAAAVSSGAFPFAFCVQEVVRGKAEYEDGPQFPFDPPAMAYTDGGVFQNQPLGLAKDLVNRIDRHRNEESRFFLFVSPDAMKSQMDANFRASKAYLWPAGVQLLKAIFHQAQYQDWVRAHETNLQVKAFEEQAGKLSELFLNGTITAAQLAPVNAPLLDKLFDGDQVAMEHERQRLREQFAKEYAALPNAAADAWIDAILVLETAAQVGRKEQMQILPIAATDEELCGELFFAFGGFFDERLREYDYQRGRKKAREFLQPFQNGTGAYGFGPVRYAPADPLPPLNDKLPKTKMEDLDEERREELRDRILERADDLLESAGLNWLIRKAALIFFIRPKVNKMFSL
jgi:hypothetical protein